MAGFLKGEGSYMLPQASHKPPVSLQVLIWPWIKDWQARFSAQAQGKR